MFCRFPLNSKKQYFVVYLQNRRVGKSQRDLHPQFHIISFKGEGGHGPDEWIWQGIKAVEISKQETAGYDFNNP